MVGVGEAVGVEVKVGVGLGEGVGVWEGEMVGGGMDGTDVGVGGGDE